MQRAEPHMQHLQERHAGSRDASARAATSPRKEHMTQLEAAIDSSPVMAAQRALAGLVNASPRQAAQQELAAGIQGGGRRGIAQQQPAKPNNTGLSDDLKSGIEQLSGMSMDHVKVHYNSSQPAQLHALAYAQGGDIHVAPGQEHHVAHEAWHVVQQAQGRVSATRQMKGGVAVNDDQGLEREADVMGSRALQLRANATIGPLQMVQGRTAVIQRLATDRLNVVGEDHPETKARLAREKRFAAAESGSSNYWTEGQFRVRAYSFADDFLNDKRAFADPFELRFNAAQQFLVGNAAVIRAQGNANDQSDAAWDDLQVQRKFIGNLWEYLSRLGVGWFDVQVDAFEVPAARRNEMHGYRQSVKNIAATWQAARVAFKTANQEPAPAAVFDWAGDGVVTVGGANARANSFTSIDALAQLNIVARTTAELSADRSLAMHAAANTRAAEPGVWKIGDAHRGHLAGYAGPAHYNLVSLATFNADYGQWQGV